jgi:LemA protein
MWLLLFTIVAVVTVLGIGAFLGVSNTRLKTRCTVVKHAREGLELQLGRRHEQIAQVLDPIKRDGSFDLDSTDNVALLADRARNATSFSERMHFENALAESLKDLLAAVDNSPELSVDESYARPRQNLEETEGDLRKALRFYNSSVNEFNQLVDGFPQFLIAAMFSFSHQESAEIASTIPEPVVEAVEPTGSIVPPPKGMISGAKRVT